MAKAKKVNKEITVDLQLKAIELLHQSLHLPANVEAESLTSFAFKVAANFTAKEVDKLLFVVVNVEVRDGQEQHVIASIVVSCVNYVANFSEVIKAGDNGNLALPTPLVEKLISDAISTTRGIMFSAFKGTFLHNAVLPIIDSSTFLKQQSVAMP
jgi:hypothetical protein